MSGGSLEYVYRDVRDAARDGFVHGEKKELVEDVADLLHSIEWSASGDYRADQWRGDLATFTEKWSGGYKQAGKVSDFGAADVDDSASRAVADRLRELADEIEGER